MVAPAAQPHKVASAEGFVLATLVEYCLLINKNRHKIGLEYLRKAAAILVVVNTHARKN